jgi:hypothetical protein
MAMRRLSSLLASLFVCSLILAPAALAETFVEREISTRLAVALQVADAKAQKWLPAPWQVSPSASGVTKGANVALTFSDRLAKVDAAGNALPDAAERTLALQVLARNAATGESGSYVFRIYTSNPRSVPGYYANSVHASVEHELSSKATGTSGGTVSQAWSIRDPNGGSVEFRVQYEIGAPVPSKPETKTYGGPDPQYFRIFRADQGVDVVKSVAAGVDRTRGASLRASVPDLQDLLDGAQIVSIAPAPWYSRLVFMP